MSEIYPDTDEMHTSSDEDGDTIILPPRSITNDDDSPAATVPTDSDYISEDRSSASTLEPNEPESNNRENRMVSLPNAIPSSSNSESRTTFALRRPTRNHIPTEEIRDCTNRIVHFISADHNSEVEKKGMKYIWGPYGLGYYSHLSKELSDMYSNRVQAFNRLSKIQRKTICQFIKDTGEWKEKGVEAFFNMVGVKKEISGIHIISSMNILKKEMCPICFEIIYPFKRKKCISFECPGMCKICSLQLGKECPVCKTNQEIKCPICLETRPVWASKILRCHHGICWKCYSQAFEQGHALINCPQCRKAI